MPDEIVTTPVETKKVKTDEVETPPAVETPLAAEAHDDPSSEKEAEATASEPEIHVDPSELGDGNEAPSPEASDATEEPSSSAPPVSASSEPVAASEDPHAFGVDTGSDAPLVPGSGASGSDAEAPPESSAGSDTASASSLTKVEDAPAEAEDAPTEPEWVGPYGDPFESAKGVVEALGEDRSGDLKDAANALFHVFESLIDKDLSGLDPQSGAILANVRNHGAGILAAIEAVFRRTR